MRAPPHTLRFDPDSRRVAVGYSQADVVSIYDAEDGSHVADLPVGAGADEVIAWHPDGNLLAAAGSDPRIQIWNVETRLAGRGAGEPCAAGDGLEFPSGGRVAHLGLMGLRPVVATLSGPAVNAASLVRLDGIQRGWPRGRE